MVNWAKNARINSSGYSPPHWVIGRGYTLPGSLLDEKQSGELASLVLPEHSPEFGRRMSWLWAARRACETMDTCHRLRRALSAGVRASAHTQGIVNGELVCLAEGQEKPNRRADGTCYPSVVWSSHCGRQTEEQCVRVLSRSRDKSCTKMSPKGQRGWANESGHYDERDSLVRKGT